MTSKQKATDLFNQFYMILFDSDSDKSEEILVSVLAIKCAIVASMELMEESGKINYYIEVAKELKKM